MPRPENALLVETENYVKQLLTQFKDKLVFHNLEHTQNVVRHCEIIASHYNLPAEEQLPLLLAAWFHDVGYTSAAPKHHEEESIRIAEEFLLNKNLDVAVVETVRNCIAATRMPQSPSTFLEQIICDSDLYHLGTDKFDEYNKQLRDEINSMQDEKVSKKEWRKINIAFLQRHRYFTDFCRERLEPLKQKHLAELVERQSKKEKALSQAEEDQMLKPAEAVDPYTVAIIEEDSEQVAEVRKIDEPTVEKEAEKPREKTKEDKETQQKEKQKRTERGVVAMFRIMSENHINLSQMADSKANIMISVNTIVISIMVSVLLGKLQFYPEFIIPTVILVSICLGAVVFAILATRPNVSSGTFTKEDIEQKKINLLFFGNFYNMKIDDYDWAMKEMMNDKDYLYGSMIKDMYYLGVVLARKYKFLRISYNIFMFGLIAALLSFGVAFFITGHAEGQQ